MEEKGLCITCAQEETCIFTKKPTVWQCEEFSSGNHVLAKSRNVKVRRVIREEATESE